MKKFSYHIIINYRITNFILAFDQVILLQHYIGALIMVTLSEPTLHALMSWKIFALKRSLK